MRISQVFRGAFSVVAAAALSIAASAARAAKGESDDWMALYLAGGKAGWMHVRVAKSEENGKPVWVTTSEQSFSLARLGTAMTISGEESVVEDQDGVVLRFTHVANQGGGPMKSEGTVKDGKIHLVQNGAASDVAYPEGALGPAAASRKLKEKGLKAGVSVEVVSFMAEAPDKRVTSTSTVGATEKKDVLGRVLFLHPVDMTNSLIPIPMKSWVDDDAQPFALSMAIPGLGDMECFKTDEKIAKAAFEPREVFTQTEIEPDRAIAKPRELKKAVYRISKKPGAATAIDKLYAGEDQSVVEKDGAWEATIDVWTPPADFHAATRPFAPAGMENFTKATAYLETGDELVKKFAAEAVGDEKDAVKCARLIETYVRRKIAKKNFNVAFATAAETARSCEGDCSEHGMLCAALARAAGLPSRVCVGVVYVSPEEMRDPKHPRGIFGFHMWTEVLVAEGRWLPIDAAIGTYDATHVAVAKSDLATASPEIDLMLPVFPVLGSIQIDVIEPR